MRCDRPYLAEKRVFKKTPRIIFDIACRTIIAHRILHSACDQWRVAWLCDVTLKYITYCTCTRQTRTLDGFRVQRMCNLCRCTMSTHDSVLCSVANMVWSTVISTDLHRRTMLPCCFQQPSSPVLPPPPWYRPPLLPPASRIEHTRATNHNRTRVPRALHFFASKHELLR